MIVVNHRMLALAVAVGLFVPTTASARLDLNPAPISTAVSAPAVSQPSAPAVKTLPNPVLHHLLDGMVSHPSPPPVVQPDRVAPSGFDWGDAGIGAVGALGLSMLVIVGGQAVRGRRRRSLDSTHASGLTVAPK